MATIKKCGGRINGQWVTMNMCKDSKKEKVEDHTPHKYWERDSLSLHDTEIAPGYSAWLSEE